MREGAHRQTVGSKRDQVDQSFETHVSGSGASAPAAGIEKNNGRCFCSYCEAELNAFYYFCLRCGTPYTRPDNVLPPKQTPYINDEQRIKINAPHAMPLFWSYLGAILATIVIGQVFQVSEDPGGLLIIAMALTTFVTVLFAVLHWPTLAVQLKRTGFDKLEGWMALAAVLPLIVVATAYVSFIEAIAPAGFVENPLADLNLSWGALVLVMCVYPAVTEELGFRGLLQHWLAAALGPRKALLLASALFAGIHISVAGFPILFLGGLLMGWAKQETKSLYPSMAIHFTYNFVMLWQYCGQQVSG